MKKLLIITMLCASAQMQAGFFDGLRDLFRGTGEVAAEAVEGAGEVAGDVVEGTGEVLTGERPMERHTYEGTTTTTYPNKKHKRPIRRRVYVEETVE